jgi:hypothetical protein
LYPSFARYVCKFDYWAHILWAFSLTLKLSVTDSLCARLWGNYMFMVSLGAKAVHWPGLLLGHCSEYALGEYSSSISNFNCFFLYWANLIVSLLCRNIFVWKTILTKTWPTWSSTTSPGKWSRTLSSTPTSSLSPTTTLRCWSRVWITRLHKASTWSRGEYV